VWCVLTSPKPSASWLLGLQASFSGEVHDPLFESADGEFKVKKGGLMARIRRWGVSLLAHLFDSSIKDSSIEDRDEIAPR
jgi:hypothetical protein